LQPQIQFIRIQPNAIEEFAPFQIEIGFRDGDGDLGGVLQAGDSVAYNLYVQDTRPGYPLPEGGFDGIFRFTLPNLTPESRNPSIQGEIKIDLSDIAILHPDSSLEHVRFKIWLFDRAGNRSNNIITDPLLIQR
jgi:hypothetical protein